MESQSINQSSVAATLISVGDLTGASQMNQAIRGVDLATGRPLDRDQRLYNVGHGVLGIAVTFGPQLLRPTPTGPPKTEIVQRWMSRGELEAIGNTGLLRGGRPGRNYVTNNANSSLLRARQRLALDHTPEVLVTVEVPKNIFP